MAGVLAQLAVSLDARGPMDDAWRADAAVVDPGLVHAERRVGYRGPAGAETVMRAGSAWRQIWIMAVVANHDFRAGTVVGEEHDQRVVEGVHRTELIDDAADFAIH